MEQENQTALVDFIKKFKQECHTKTLWMYTGYVYDKDLLIGQRKHIQGITDYILDNVDVLIDGPFIEAQKDLTLKFRGSKNQRILTKEDRAQLCAK